MGKTCCFIGHRKVEDGEKLRKEITMTVIELINLGIDTFLFGSRSQFDELCHEMVTELKNTAYPEIIRKSYICRSEVGILERERENLERSWSRIQNRPITFWGVEEVVEYKNKYSAGRANYVERNEAMIDDSDVCVFYYNKDYLPPRRKNSKKDYSDYQPKSGTAIAYIYAVRKKKPVYNLFNR